MLDPIDKAIIQCLQEDARSQWKEIGRRVHLTGQAVAERVRSLEEAGVIEGYTVCVDAEKAGKPLTAFITVHMKTNDHAAFTRFAANRTDIEVLHRISGPGCYWLRAAVASQVELNELLDAILQYANYQVAISLGKVK